MRFKFYTLQNVPGKPEGPSVAVDREQLKHR
jgi:hypothetical protein